LSSKQPANRETVSNKIFEAELRDIIRRVKILFFLLATISWKCIQQSFELGKLADLCSAAKLCRLALKWFGDWFYKRFLNWQQLEGLSFSVVVSNLMSIDPVGMVATPG